MADLSRYVDKRYEDHDLEDLPEAPVDALRGLGQSSVAALRKALGVRTIRDLADNKFVLWAQELVLLAEHPEPLAKMPEAESGERTAEDAMTRFEYDDATPDTPPNEPATGTAGADDTLTRSEEELRVDTERVRRGQAAVRKHVVTEQEEHTVPVEREELRVERQPITGADRDAGVDRAEIAEGEQVVDLHEERPVVSKQVVPKERVRVDKAVVRGHERVAEPVRRERVEVDGPDPDLTDQER
jgi:uncharacterized protein (TIGR02271 family)